jgi:hypothetical protein
MLVVVKINSRIIIFHGSHDLIIVDVIVVTVVIVATVVIVVIIIIITIIIIIIISPIVVTNFIPIIANIMTTTTPSQSLSK